MAPNRQPLAPRDGATDASVIRHPSSVFSDAEGELFTLLVPGGVSERRLDQWLAAQLPELTRSRIQALAKQGCLTDGEGRALTKLSAAPQPGTTLLLTLPPAEPTDLLPEDIPLSILYEDDHLLALDKPAGLVVHPACGHSHGTLVNALLFHCPDLQGIGGEKRPGIVHRLDMDTSGVMVVAKTERAHRALVEAFAEHRLTKRYLAITHWQLLCPLPNGLYALQCLIDTGRTHQIRVHLASLGTPIAGDALYGKPGLDRRLPTPPARQLLHARELSLAHPITGEPLRFLAPLPADFLDAGLTADPAER